MYFPIQIHQCHTNVYACVYFSDHNEYVFNPEQILIYSKIGLGLPNRVITFVTADEAGGNSDARARISDGGPGYDFVEVEIIPGPSQSYHYVITVYGRDLETPEVDTSEKKVSKSFFYK